MKRLQNMVATQQTDENWSKTEKKTEKENQKKTEKPTKGNKMQQTTKK